MKYKFECMPVDTLDIGIKKQALLLDVLMQMQNKINTMIKTYNLENDRLHKVVKELQDELGE